MNDMHLSAVLSAMSRSTDIAERRALRDLSIELTNRLNSERMAATMAEAAKVEGAAVTLEDAALVDVLLGKGINANGLNPELSTMQIGRAIAVMQHAIIRTTLGTLSFEETRFLEEIFDKAAENEATETVQNLRFIEAKTRLGLGLEKRGLSAPPPEHVS